MRTVPPLVPLMTRVYVPLATFLRVSTVNVDVPELTMVVGVNWTFVWPGTPLTDSAIVPTKPVPPGTVTV